MNTMPISTTVADRLAADLAAYGARRCFGLLGTANFKISHALVAAGVELISARHEMNAASMADAYAKATGELTLVSVHCGPGLSNALTGIGEAAKSRTPLLVLAGDVPSGAVTSNFYIEQAEMVRSVGAAAERIHTPATARQDTLRAVVRALSERTTVVLSFADRCAGRRLVRRSAAAIFAPRAGAGPSRSRDPASLGRCARAAQRPLLLAGRGAVIAGAEQALAALAAFSGALIATSVCGHGLLAEDAWCLGISGGFASPAADALIAKSDLIIGFGVSLTPWTTKRGKLIAAEAVVAQIDVDPGRFGRHTRLDHAVLGDARVTAEALLAELKRRRAAARSGWRDAATRQRLEAGSNHTACYEDVSTADGIDPRTLSKAVDAILPRERVVASDSGHFCGWVPRYLRVPNARASCLSHSFQSVGLGLASVIGLALANPGALAVLGAGDGGFLMSISDLETALRLKLRLCILIYNDSSYAAEVHLYRRAATQSTSCSFPTRISPRSRAAMAPGRQRADARRSRAASLLGTRRRARRLRHRRQDQSQPRADWHAEHFP
jgi:thiamine pyrophosphate-dependent acetolactate synthase large subunit-like protein